MNGKVFIVTGSTRGIGKSIALHLAKCGAKVVINGRTEESVTNAVNDLNKKGYEAIGVPGSVEMITTGEALVKETLSNFGVIDGIINNAGIVRDRMSHRMSEQEWDDVISVNLKGTFSCTIPFIRYMKELKRSGSIINMTSLAGIEGTIGQLNYSAAKAGIIGMTKTWAKELASLNIRVYAIAPAAYTDMTRPFLEEQHDNDEKSNYWDIGTADDVARFVLALVENKKQTISGEVFSINGKSIGIWHNPAYEILSENGVSGIQDL
ncbi:SDR family NAD(P)-dependent oxidoreductase [Bacillus solitudinis]|uniref:SDR family NAD(P)-dependent oxidoreductase n=1 Tax=Bacillus solitudinis TaxID=2014074 RepID=UPI000C24D631|nr:SDR family NAD(P)-dependent oxidoreductase [Bacillus solitudinis]